MHPSRPWLAHLPPAPTEVAILASLEASFCRFDSPNRGFGDSARVVGRRAVPTGRFDRPSSSSVVRRAAHARDGRASAPRERATASTMTGGAARRALARGARAMGAMGTTTTRTTTTTTTRGATRTIARAMDDRAMGRREMSARGGWETPARERCAWTRALGKEGFGGGARARGFASEGKPEDETTAEDESGEDAEGDGEGEDEVSRLRGELEEKDAKVADLTDRILRTMAEMENLRERTRRQAEDAKKFAIQGFCKDLLDVADNLDRAIATVTVDDDENDVEKVKTKLKSFHEGVVMTEKTLLSAFKKHGVTKFNPEGEEFDANSHMALFNVPIPEGSDAKAGTVAAVTKTGYSLHERVIRAAEVGVYQ